MAETDAEFWKRKHRELVNSIEEVAFGPEKRWRERLMALEYRHKVMPTPETARALHEWLEQKRRAD